MSTLDVESIDLAELARLLRPHEAELVGELDGRSVMRDLVAAHLECSMLEAEELVDTLVVQGYARLVRDPEGLEGWRLKTSAP
jgi:hypothetical protein